MPDKSQARYKFLTTGRLQKPHHLVFPSPRQKLLPRMRNRGKSGKKYRVFFVTEFAILLTVELICNIRALLFTRKTDVMAATLSICDCRKRFPDCPASSGLRHKRLISLVRGDGSEMRNVTKSDPVAEGAQPRATASEVRYGRAIAELRLEYCTHTLWRHQVILNPPKPSQTGRYATHQQPYWRLRAEGLPIDCFLAPRRICADGRYRGCLCHRTNRRLR